MEIKPGRIISVLLPNDGTSVEITRYNTCAKNAEVVLVKVNGGAQYLPASIAGPVSNEINANEMILDFFLSHSKNGYPI